MFSTVVESMVSQRRRGIAALLLLCISVFAYLAYSRGVAAFWTFDDSRALEALEGINDLESALAFIVHDRYGGVLRRPLAMASFLLNLRDWPLHPSGFRHVNVLIHLFNGLLVGLVALRIGRLIPVLAPRAEGLAVTLAAAWLLHPLLVSTSMMVIQRMTLLAATFSLLGFVAYLHGRSLASRYPLRAAAWMMGGLGVATLLGVLAKENAILTPLLVAVTEYTVLARYAPIAQRSVRAVQWVTFFIPALAIVGYMAYYLAYGVAGYVIRPFTLEERLWSQAVILFEYLRQIVMPDIAAMGPFQDDASRIRGAGPVTVLAAAAWFVLAAAAIVLRARAPALSFAVGFFLVGHLLESSIFNLELYFEHRNYLPSLGVLGALAALCWSTKAVWPRALAVAFPLVMGVLLWQTTTLWGDPYRSAQVWFDTHPTSTRAVQNLANAYQSSGAQDQAAEIIVNGYRGKPLDAGLAAYAVVAQCFREIAAEHSDIFDRVIRDAPRLVFHQNATQALHSIIDLRIMGRCDTVPPEVVRDISIGLLSNPGFLSQSITRYDLHMSIARSLELIGDSDEAMIMRKNAFDAEPLLSVADEIFSYLHVRGRNAEARSFLNDARKRAPEMHEHFDAWESLLR